MDDPIRSRRIQQLVLLAQSGDDEAFDQVLAHVQEPLFAYLRGMLGDDHLAEDVLQDVYVLAWRKLLWLRDPDLFRPWVHRIATRAAWRAWKRAGGRREVPAGELEADALVAPEEAPELEPELGARLPELVARVSPAARPVLLLHYGEGMTLDEVAAVLDLSPGTVRSRLHYGLRALRERLGSAGPPNPTNP